MPLPLRISEAAVDSPNIWSLCMKMFDKRFQCKQKTIPTELMKTGETGTNAYVLDLPSTYKISHVLNIEDLTEYRGDAIDNEPSEDPVIRIPTAPVTRDEIDRILDHQFVSTRHRGGSRNRRRNLCGSIRMKFCISTQKFFMITYNESCRRQALLGGNEIDASSTLHIQVQHYTREQLHEKSRDYGFSFDRVFSI
ncbi:hypothetical protein Ddye_013163 [Dipteronia dyeriana]|uniref:Uncharacterized protein n=1 Tax=Dipteronia dyeriana TaxID=168575 RepID=A0AAE0CJC3_9ROSI|nr:hypothetical protein Ddye_013163 [Dipteronia dyeriana]